MRILTITSNHPPYHSGGYGLRVKDIMDGLVNRGHTVRVLTNAPERKAGSRVENSFYPVIRKLHDRNKARFFPREVLIDLQDTALLEKQINKFRPDVIYIGHLYILSKALLPFLARQNTPIVYDEGGSGLIDAWNDHGRWFRFTGDYRSRFALLNLIKPSVIKLVCWLSRGRITPQWSWPKNMRIIFNSWLNQRNAVAQGVPVENSSVHHSGVDTQLFTYQPRIGFNSPLHIFVPGRIERRKGQLDSLELLRQLTDAGIDARVTFAGAGWVDGYLEEVNRQIIASGLADKITLMPMLSPREMVRQYQNSDICFFPSYQEIGLSRTPLEAMACGCLVISYGNEGSDEIIQNGDNGYTVEPGDYQQMLDIITYLISNPEQTKIITNFASHNLSQSHSLGQYVDSVEQLLIKAMQKQT